MLILGFICRFALFRKTIAAKMKHATKSGVAVACKLKEDRMEVTAKEESLLWKKGLLGCTTAKSLLYAVCFYNGEIFGLRAGL
jgi:hypothetical protein